MQHNVPECVKRNYQRSAVWNHQKEAAVKMLGTSRQPAGEGAGTPVN